MITYKLHLIRHGQTEGNQKGLFVGRTDMPVSEEGFDELSRLRDILFFKLFDGVWKFAF